MRLSSRFNNEWVSQMQLADDRVVFKKEENTGLNGSMGCSNCPCRVINLFAKYQKLLKQPFKVE